MGFLGIILMLGAVGSLIRIGQMPDDYSEDTMEIFAVGLFWLAVICGVLEAIF